MRELSLDEMGKVSGGSHLDEDGYWIFDGAKCEECGGDYTMTETTGRFFRFIGEP